MKKIKIEDFRDHNKEYKVFKCPYCNRNVEIIDLDDIYELIELKKKIEKLDLDIDELFENNKLIRK